MKRVLVGLCAGAVLMVFASAASAATLTVTTTADVDNTTGSCATAGNCTLRQAVNQSNLDGGDTIVVPALGSTYLLGTLLGPLTFSKSATVTGAGASSTVIDGGGPTPGGTQILSVQSPAAVTVTGVTLQDGGSSDRGGAAQVASGASLTLNHDSITENTAPTGGGAIEDFGTVSIDHSEITSNTTDGQGGAIELLNFGASGASLSVTNSTLSGNTGSQGGAISEENFGTGTTAVTVDHSTLSGNAASSGPGGGLKDSSGSSPSTMTVTDSTITGNTAAGGSGGANIGNGPTADTFINDTIVGNTALGQNGGNIGLGGGTKPTFTNTIVAGGSALVSGPDCHGTVTSGGHNIDDLNGCGFSAAGDRVNTNPHVGGLADNGGPTQTMALQTGSPAIDAGTNTGCPGTDQRGVARPQGSACDIGAYEVAPPSGSTEAATGVGTTTATLNGTASNPDAVAATVTFQYGTSTSYGASVTKSAAAFSGQTGYSAALTSLSPNTTYHYRLVVTNPDGTSTGQDRTFTTAKASPSNKFSIGKRRVTKKGTITVKLTAPGAGTFKGKATFKAHHKKFTYGGGKRSVSGAGTVTLTIKLTKHARKELLKLGHATVSVTITFTPTGGTSHSKTIKLKINVNETGRVS